MSTEPNIHDDRALDIIPPIQACLPTDVKTVEVVGSFRLRATFFDGVAGIVDMTELVHSPRAGVFAALADSALFAQAFVLYGAVTWPGELDLSPDVMYDEFKTKGEWVLRRQATSPAAHVSQRVSFEPTSEALQTLRLARFVTPFHNAKDERRSIFRSGTQDKPAMPSL